MLKKIQLIIYVTISVGCSSFPINNIAPGYIETFRSIKNAVTCYESDFISRELIDNIPYASITLKIGKGPKGLLILESIENDKFYWISADSIYLVIKDGRIIKTEGLDNDLKEVIYPRTNFREILTNKSEQINVYYSYTNPELNNLELEVNYRVLASEQIEILNKYMALTLVHEEVSNRKLGWKFINKYWLDENYFVWKSHQYISPLVPAFNIEVTKKPSI